jgi:hypothetical protein
MKFAATAVSAFILLLFLSDCFKTEYFAQQYAEGWLCLIADDPKMHGFQTDDWKEWFQANKIAFVPEPPNSSNLTSALDLVPFGVEQKLTNKVNNAVSQLYAHDGITNYVLNTKTLELEISHTDTRTAFERAGGVYAKNTTFAAYSLSFLSGIEQKRTVRSMLLIRELVYREFLFKDLAMGVKVIIFQISLSSVPKRNA